MAIEQPELVVAEGSMLAATAPLASAPAAVADDRPGSRRIRRTGAGAPASVRAVAAVSDLPHRCPPAREPLRLHLGRPGPPSCPGRRDPPAAAPRDAARRPDGAPPGRRCRAAGRPAGRAGRRPRRCRAGRKARPGPRRPSTRHRQPPMPDPRDVAAADPARPAPGRRRPASVARALPRAGDPWPAELSRRVRVAAGGSWSLPSRRPSILTQIVGAAPAADRQIGDQS